MCDIRKAACILIFLLLFETPEGGSASQGDAGLEASRQLDASRIAAHVNFLAHDLLEGRETATRGYDVAAAYVASQFAQLGLTPSGDANSFLQRVPFRKATVVANQCSITLIHDNTEETLQYEKDFVMSDDYLRTETSVTAEVVFAGFGVTAPELNYDDYASVDVEGKLIALFSGAPPSFAASQRAHYSSSQIKEKNAVKHGAVGILTVRTPVDEKRQPWDRTVRNSKQSGFRWVDQQGKPNKIFPELQATALLSRAGSEKLFQASKRNLKETFDSIDTKTVRGFPFGIQARLSKVTLHESAESSNVVGLLRGSDPKRRNEHVVYSAHLDHLGITDPVRGDSINNGAYDNATGIAALIEIARTFANLKPKPKRSILFVAVTAEEKGLQGSDYFANFPSVPSASIVANVNMDMFLMLFPVADVVILGAEHSSLGPLAKKVAQDLGLQVRPDPAPEEVRFIRSDQYSFIKKGIPAVKFVTGFQSADPQVNGKEITKQWLLSTYHTPQDDTAQKIHWETGIKLIQANFLTGYRIAESPYRPKWNPGDFFGTIRR